MNGFEIYKVYLAVKLHFTSKNQSYDFHKHGGRTTARLETFTKRRDRYFFHKLSQSYNSSNIVDYFVSNFVKEWSKKIEALHYYYEQDIDYLIERMTANDMTFDDIFTVQNGQHPPILKMVLSKRISLETFVILEDLLSFTKRLNEDISETVLWPKLCDRMERYRPFLHYNITKYRVTLRNKLKDLQ